MARCTPSSDGPRHRGQRSRACQPGSVGKLAEGNQRNLRLKPRSVPQEPVQENLACVTDVHLLEPLIQRRDEHGDPEQVDGAEALAVSQQPVGERLAGSFIASSCRAATAIRVRTRTLVAGAQEPGRQKTARQGETELARCPRRNRGNSTVGCQERPARARGGASRRSPSRWQKSARFVQQAMLTCPAVVDAFTGRRVGEQDRRPPPNLGRLSTIVIRNPRSTRAEAVARPARPPPTIRT